MVLGALGTLNRSSGVRTVNTELDGKPVALALIEDAQFGEDTEGNTTLDLPPLAGYHPPVGRSN